MTYDTEKKALDFTSSFVALLMSKPSSVVYDPSGNADKIDSRLTGPAVPV